MLKKMQRRFILAVMAAFGCVMLILTTGINLINYFQITASEDAILDQIYEYNQNATQYPDMTLPSITEMDWPDGEEAGFTMRFFSVSCDSAGNLLSFDDSYISSIDETTAQEYAKEAVGQARMRGYHKDYRYRVEKTDTGYEVIFLNVAAMQSVSYSLLTVSLTVGMSSFLLVLVLVVLFSKRAIRPFAENMERQKRFITDAGHELKTPVTSIITSADILSCEYEDNEWVQNIQRQSSRLTKLVGDLVALSRLDETSPCLESEMFSLTDAAWEISESLADLAKAKRKSYTPQIENGLQMVGDRSKIQQLLSILLENAIQYSDENGDIVLNITRKSGKIHIIVRNTCVFETKPDVAHWFDRFYRPDQSRSVHTGGTGIGLSMAQAIVEAHKGNISAKVENGNAVVFKVIL